MELTLSLVPQNIFTSITVPYNIDDVAELKSVIEEVHGLSPDEYRLVASGRVLEDQMVLKNLNLYKVKSYVWFFVWKFIELCCLRDS